MLDLCIAHFSGQTCKQPQGSCSLAHTATQLANLDQWVFFDAPQIEMVDFIAYKYISHPSFRFYKLAAGPLVRFATSQDAQTVMQEYKNYYNPQPLAKVMHKEGLIVPLPKVEIVMMPKRPSLDNLLRNTSQESFYDYDLSYEGLSSGMGSRESPKSSPEAPATISNGFSAAPPPLTFPMSRNSSIGSDLAANLIGASASINSPATSAASPSIPPLPRRRSSAQSLSASVVVGTPNTTPARPPISVMTPSAHQQRPVYPYLVQTPNVSQQPYQVSIVAPPAPVSSWDVDTASPTNNTSNQMAYNGYYPSPTPIGTYGPAPHHHHAPQTQEGPVAQVQPRNNSVVVRTTHVRPTPSTNPYRTVPHYSWTASCTEMVLNLLRENALSPEARPYSSGWQALFSIWGLHRENLDEAVLACLALKQPHQQEQILLSFASIDLASVHNLSAYLNCLIKEHENTNQLCLNFLAGLCTHPNCGYIHPCGTPGWNALHEKWGVTYRDFDYAVLNYLSKKNLQVQDQILLALANANVGGVVNLSAYLSRQIQKYEGGDARPPRRPRPRRSFLDSDGQSSVLDETLSISETITSSSPPFVPLMDSQFEQNTNTQIQRQSPPLYPCTVAA